jgi:hypothetical protein
MNKFFRNNSLSLVFLLLFLIALAGQAFTGLKQYNQKKQNSGQNQVTLNQYVRTGHFIEATFENWESEFLQMAFFVFLTMFFYQKGSSESKDPGKKEDEEYKPNQGKKGAPTAVKKGGWVLGLYQHSLSIILFLLFLLSFCLHWYGSLKDFNEEQVQKGLPPESAFGYLSNSRLWFESFENWQSEFLSVFAIVILSIYFRQKNSPQSKPVDAPHSQTG